MVERVDGTNAREERLTDDVPMIESSVTQHQLGSSEPKAGSTVCS